MPSETEPSFVEWFGALYSKARQKRFKLVSTGYKVDRWLFQAAMLLVFAWLAFVTISYNYSLDYYKCESGNQYYETGDVCKNPFYKQDSAWKGQEYLPPGEYGTKPGPLFYSVTWIPICLFVVAGLLNHFIHNCERGVMK